MTHVSSSTAVFFTQSQCLAFVYLQRKPHYLGKHGSPESKAKYHAIVGKWMLEQSRGAPDTPNLTSPLTLSELCDMYTAYVKERYPKDSQYNYRCMVLWVTKDYGEHPAGDLNGSQIDGLQQKMVAEDLTRRYINDITKMVKRMYKWAYGRSHVPEATYRRLEVVEGIGKGRLGARDNPPIRPVSDDVIEKTVRQLPTLVAAMVRFQRLTGCRPQDVCNLNEAEIDRTEDIWVYRCACNARVDLAHEWRRYTDA
ncbi:MAG: hypothetical protein ACKVK0_10105 [Pirellulales bacterium]